MKHLTISALLDVLAELFSEEVSIGITDKNNYLYFRPSKRIDLKIRAGDPIRNDTLAYKALTSGKKVSNLFTVMYMACLIMEWLYRFIMNKKLKEHCLQFTRH